MKIEYKDNLPTAQHEHVLEGLSSFAVNTRGLSPMRSWAFLAREQGKTIGSISGYILYGAIHVDLLYVDKIYRGKGVGSQLIAALEAYAKQQKVLQICLSTFDFEARPFYEKCGYTLEFERDGYEQGVINYHMIKKI